MSKCICGLPIVMNYGNHGDWLHEMPDGRLLMRDAQDTHYAMPAPQAEKVEARKENKVIGRFDVWFEKWEEESSGFTKDEIKMCRYAAHDAWNEAVKPYCKPQPTSWQSRAEAAEATNAELEHELRLMFWLGHGHTGMYGDDGEMQCIQCAQFKCVDYKREPLQVVREAYRAAQLLRIQSAQTAEAKVESLEKQLADASEVLELAVDAVANLDTTNFYDSDMYLEAARNPRQQEGSK